MTNRHAEQIIRAAARGLRPSRADACLRVVAGRLCLRGRPGSCKGCPYGRAFTLDIWDRARMWLDASGNRVLTLEPSWPPSTDNLADLRAAAAELGLTVTVEPPERSFYYPGHTHLITITRAT